MMTIRGPRHVPFVLSIVTLASMAGACHSHGSDKHHDKGKSHGAAATSVDPHTPTTLLNGKPDQAVTQDGLPVVFAHPNGPGRHGAQAGHADRHLVEEPNTPDPRGGHFTLQQAVKGLGNDGTLVAEIRTDLGTFECDLYADKTPNTVANFIGLARGMRQWWDERAGEWVQQPAYDGTIFHRVIPGYMIQGGDYLGDGSGAVGYTIPDELRPDLLHDKAGQLCMANRGPNTNGAQFFITDGPAPQLDQMHTYTIFGECRPNDLVARIARVPQSGAPDNRPLTPVRITKVIIRRVHGGAANAHELPPRLPPGVHPGQPLDHGASPGPSQLAQPGWGTGVHIHHGAPSGGNH